MGILGVLLVVFIVLKLVGVIAWSWVWVLAPLWVGAAFWSLLALAALVIGGIAHRLTSKSETTLDSTWPLTGWNSRSSRKVSRR